MKQIYTGHDIRQRYYVPPALGNGSLSLMIDREGQMAQQAHCSMTPGIVRAGFRYEHPEKELISYGYFLQEIPGAGAVNAAYIQPFESLKLVNTAVEGMRKLHGPMEEELES